MNTPTVLALLADAMAALARTNSFLAILARTPKELKHFFASLSFDEVFSQLTIGFVK